MIDSHCHIFDEAFIDDYDLVLNRAKDSLNKLLLVGFSSLNNELAYNLSLKEPGFIYPTAGLHPSEVKEDYLAELAKLEDFIQKHRVYALGECGLDYHWDITYKEKQQEAFRKQIELSIKYDLPLIIHSRDAIQDTYDILKEYPKAYGVMHCYSGSVEMAKLFLNLGFYLGFGGPLTFKNAKVPKEVLKETPLDRILIETDSPYLAPMPYRGKRNEPSFVKYVLEEASKIKETNILELEKIIDSNTIRLFRLE